MLVRKFVSQYGMWVSLVLLLMGAYLMLRWVIRGEGWQRPPEHRPNRQSFVRAVTAVSPWPKLPPNPPEDWALVGTLMSEGERLALLMRNDRERQIVRVGDRIDGQWSVTAIYAGQVSLRAGALVRTLGLPNSLAPVLPKLPQEEPPATLCIDLARPAALEAFSRIRWQTIPLGRGAFHGFVVETGSPRAALFGLAEGDILEAVNGLPVEATGGAERVLDRLRADDGVTLGVRRQGRRFSLALVLHD